MPLRLCYVDESHNRDVFCLSALTVRHTQWKECFDRLREFRQRMNADHGLFIRKEIHANEFLAGRGRVSATPIPKALRVRIVRSLLDLVGGLPGVMLFNVCLKKSKHRDPQMVAWDRLLNRIQRALVVAETGQTKMRRELLNRIRDRLDPADMERIERWSLEYAPRALIIADEGREREIEMAHRKMHVFNPVPSSYGDWGDGSRSKNITIDHVIEDPVFKSSARSMFIQAVDCAVYSLLMRETPPSLRAAKYGLHRMFDTSLQGICYTKAARFDPLGIVRK